MDKDSLGLFLWFNSFEYFVRTGQQKQHMQHNMGINSRIIKPATTISTSVEDVRFVISGKTESGSRVSHLFPRYSRLSLSRLHTQIGSPTAFDRRHSPPFLQGLGLH